MELTLFLSFFFPRQRQRRQEKKQKTALFGEFFRPPYPLISQAYPARIGATRKILERLNMTVERRRISYRHLPPETLDCYATEQGLWHETEADIAKGLIEGQKKRLLLNWVRRQMRRDLSEVEQRAIQLYYFKGFSFREAGKRLGVTPSSVQRAVQRGIRKLRLAKKRDPSWRKLFEE